MILDIMHVFNYIAVIWIGVVFLWVGTSLVLKVKLGKSNLKLTLIITLFSFSVIAFNYSPSVYTDLYRHYKLLDLMRLKNDSFYYSHELITSLLFTLVAKTDYNNFLPLITTTIRYALFFFLLYIYIVKFNISSFNVKLFLFFYFAFFPLIESISGVRYYFAISILGCAIIYNYYFGKKIESVLLLISSVLIHTSSSIFIFLRVLAIKKIYTVINPFKYLLLIWSLFYLQISTFFAQFDTSFSSTAASSIVIYVEEDREISLNLTIARVAIILIIFTMFFVYKKYCRGNFKDNINYYNFLELILLFTLGSVFVDVFFQRSVFFVILICMPLFFDFFNSRTISGKLKRILVILIIVLSIGMYANQIYGLLVGYF